MACLTLFALAAWAAPPANAADSVYWTNAGDNTIRGAPLAGGGTVDTLYGPAQGVSDPFGVAIDPAAGRIYWASASGSTIRGAPLAGGGTVDTLYAGTAQGVNGQRGVAIDPAAGRIYWANQGDNTIRGAPLAGGGTVDTLYGSTDGVNGPQGLAIDPAAGRIYWANVGGSTIRGAPLAGGGTVDTLYEGLAQGVSVPFGVAIDPAAGRIYWANAGGSTIRGAPLAGGGTVDTLYDSGQGVAAPLGVAIDPAAGRIYWANQGDTTIRGAPLAGGGTVDTLYGLGQEVSNPLFLAALRAPLGVAAPAISGGGQVGQLACSQGGWAPDLLGAQLYRAPQGFAYQWRAERHRHPRRDGELLHADDRRLLRLPGDGLKPSRLDLADERPGERRRGAAENPKCKKLRKKLKRQKKGLANATTEAKRSMIQENIADTKRRLKKRGCKVANSGLDEKPVARFPGSPRPENFAYDVFGDWVATQVDRRLANIARLNTRRRRR